MNPRLAAFYSLNEILLERNNSEKIMARNSAEIESKQDHNLYFTLVKGAIKQKIHLEFLLKNYIDFNKTDPKVLNLLLLGLFQLTFLDSIPAYACVNETINISNKEFKKGVSSFINAVLRSYIRKDKKIQLPRDIVQEISVTYSFPVYLIKKWVSIFGKEDTIALCKYFNSTPQLTLRIETDKISIDKFSAYLTKKGILFSTSNYFDNMIVIESSFNFLEDEYFKKGYFYIQNESALLPVLLLNPQKGEKILDMCAAPGGKALYLASLMRDTVKITAVDNDSGRVMQFKENTKRMKHSSIDIVMKDVLYLKSPSTFDKIIIDAPCTGWGVMQRKPDIRLQSENRLKSLIPLQQKLLEKADSLLKKNGIIVYSTCTINPDENEKQIEKFMKNHSNYTLIEPDQFVEKDFVSGKYIKTYPFKHNMDGSFAAALRKVS
jgi:16S rRNA (cytosine967-C5)-methyltransferase